MKLHLTLLIFLSTLSVSSSAFAQAESFTLRNLDGDQVKSHDVIGKKPVLLDFWSTWCKPCLKNLPKLQKVYEEYADKGLAILPRGIGQGLILPQGRPHLILPQDVMNINGVVGGLDSGGI